MRVLVLREYKSQEFDGVRLSAADRRAVADERFARRLRVRELTGGRVEVSAGPHVGVVSLDGCEIRVEPKYLGTGLDVLRMVHYALGNAPEALTVPRTFTDGAPHLRDLVALMVTTHAEQLLARGVRRDYVRREAPLPAVRGRLLPDRQLLHHYGQLDRLACRYDDFDTDIVDNRVCAAAADLAARTTSSLTVRARARRVAGRFAQYAPTRPADVRADLGRLTYHRHNEHYRPAHFWSALLLTGGGLDDLFGAGPLAARAFLIDMNELFELFATRLLAEAAAGTGTGTGLTVEGQSRHTHVLWNERTARPYSEVRPDVLIRGGTDALPFVRPVDVKYKLYATRKVSTADLYQAFLYAHALARDPGDAPPTCVLLHPGGVSGDRAAVAVRRWDGSTSARVRPVPLDLHAALGALESPRRAEFLSELLAEVTRRG
ncbi:McrC family protein [Streptomyces sp. NPDC059639]|uniref:McrC family protein n=1 Tax=Streptomyces sp. NPDC059639 TaxID=3346891 RepID=UPI003692D99C